MPEIHASSFVDDQAELADDVVVGPMCVIEGPVKIGGGTRLLHRVSLQGPLTIGEDNTLYPNVCLGFAGQSLKYDPTQPGPGVVIGDRNTFREGATVHRATLDHPTTIGSDNYFMSGAHVAHDCILGNHIIFATGGALGGHVEIGDHVVGIGNCGIHQFCRIGRMAMIGGVIAVTQDIPPFCMAASTHAVSGLNIIGLRRGGLREHVDALREAFRLFFRENHTPKVAVALIRDRLGDDPLCVEFADFCEGTKRGISPYRGGRDG